ncbi:MAG TPA: asparagine synthetase B, partial [Myxococcaceae bacterium]|nr:asparagine synthetase B [Myxococcaceae bacterium]
MCGIAGILGRLDERNRSALRRMSAALVHRGPDDEGTWESAPAPDGSGALLAFRRLSIIDLSPAGHQPMVDPVGGQVIVFNGEVYNFRELRTRLEAEGHHFRSTGDTAVVLRMLALHGPDALPRLRGMYGFGLWDDAGRTLLLARDPLGIKPLYVARCTDPGAGWALMFASEVRALLASGLLGTPRLDPSAPASLAWNGFLVGPRTAVDGVESLLPGELRLYGEHGDERLRREYWQVPSPGSGPDLDDAPLASRLEECVRLHLVSDVPLGVFLSGGIDSSAVANLAKRAARGPVHTFTLAF